MGVIDEDNGNLVCYTFTRLMDICEVTPEKRTIVFSPGPDGVYPTLWGHPLNTGEAFYTNDPASHEASTGTPEGHIPISSFLSAPALSSSKLVGQIALANSSRPFSDEDLKVVRQLAQLLSLAINRQRMEDEVRDNEELLSNTLDALTANIAVLDETGTVIRVNRAWREFAEENGADPDSVSEGANCLAVLDAAGGDDRTDASAVAAAIREVLAGERESFELEYPCHSPDEQQWFVGRVTKFHGTGPGKVAYSHENITWRKQAEERVRQSEARYRALFERMQEGFALHEIVLDDDNTPVDYRFLAINPAFEHLTGLNAEEITGKTVLDVMPDTDPFWIQTYGNVALTGEPMQFEHYPGALDRYYEVTAFRPSPGQFACIFTDVTDRRNAERERQELQEKVMEAQRLESLGVLAGGVAHDFNNLLQVIGGAVDLLEMDVELHTRRRQAVPPCQRRHR